MKGKSSMFGSGLILLVFISHGQDLSSEGTLEHQEGSLDQWKASLRKGFSVRGVLHQRISYLGPMKEGNFQYEAGMSENVAYELTFAIGDQDQHDQTENFGDGIYHEISLGSQYSGDWQCTGSRGVRRIRDESRIATTEKLWSKVSCSSIRFLPGEIDLCALSEVDLLDEEAVKKAHLLLDTDFPKSPVRYYWARKNGQKHAIVQVSTSGKHLGSWYVWLRREGYWARLGGGILDWENPSNNNVEATLTSYETFDAPRKSASSMSFYTFAEFRYGETKPLGLTDWIQQSGTPVVDETMGKSQMGMVHQGEVLWYDSSNRSRKENSRRLWRVVGSLVFLSGAFFIFRLRRERRQFG